MDYTKDDVRAAETLLEADSGLVEQVQAYASSMDLNDPLGKTERFHAQVKDIPANVGSLLIAAAIADHVNFGAAHLCLKTELLYQGQPPLTEDEAVEEAYQILDAHGAITIARLEKLEKETKAFADELRAVDKAFKEAAASSPREKIINFYEARARFRAKAQEA
ncbi:hypothetical protein KY310_00615 [Candidatus Woesearchaeota archaeon]|nr:hypothetical protein [Candidatus Woesearchaeota archaeon]